MNTWYRNLKKAPWTPPNWVFGWVWFFLYICMAASLYLAWTNKKCYPYCNPLLYFFIQLLLNLVWTTIFFKYKKPLLALLDLCLMLCFAAYTAFLFYDISKLASYLLIPYLIWLLVALSMNVYIIIYN